MSDFLKAVFLSFVMFILGLGVFWIGPLPKGVGHNQPPASAPTLAKPTATAAATQSPSPVIILARGPYRVQGNAILGADGNRYLFHGVGRDSLEYSCWGDGHFDAQDSPTWAPVLLPPLPHIGEQTPYDCHCQRASGCMDNPRSRVWLRNIKRSSSRRWIH